MAAVPDDIRIALAARAYREGHVRLVAPDLGSASHLVATRRGLFAVDRRGARLIAHGLFYGLTLHDDAILAFEACDRPHSPSAQGRIVRFRRAGDRLVGADVIARGLDNGCHQIDVIGGALCVVDTYNQRVLRWRLAAPGGAFGGEPEALHPLPPAAANDWAGGYAHVNSIMGHGEAVLLMLHNGGARTGRRSEILRLDRNWRPVGRYPLDGLGCHNLAVLEDGRVLACGSFAGGLVADDGMRVPVDDMMTRGLSVGEDEIAVGGSAFGARDARDGMEGAVVFLDRSFLQRAKVTLPGPVTEIRRLDGQDRGLSRYLAALSAA